MLKLLYGPGNPLPFIQPRELETCVHIKTCTWMFTAASFIIGKKWKQPKYASTESE